MPDGKIYVATTSIVTTIDGHNRSIHRGQTAREGHPILRSHGEIFVPLVPDFEVEDKPAAPSAPGATLTQTAPRPALPRPMARGRGKADPASP